MAIDEVDPIIDNWYQNLENGLKFKVVAIDDDTGAIDVQFHDGDLEEYDTDSWLQLDIEMIEPSEDWDGSGDSYLEDLQEDDYSSMSMDDTPQFGDETGLGIQEDTVDSWN